MQASAKKKKKCVVQKAVMCAFIPIMKHRVAKNAYYPTYRPGCILSSVLINVIDYRCFVLGVLTESLTTPAPVFFFFFMRSVGRSQPAKGISKCVFVRRVLQSGVMPE